MFFSVLLMRQGELEMGLGEEMYAAVKNGCSEMPPAVDFEAEDSSEIKQLKELIVVMTSYARTERPTAEAVLQALRAMQP